MRLRRCARRTGSCILNHTRPKYKMAPQGGHSVFWRRGWDSRFATGHAPAALCPSNRVLHPQSHSAKIQNGPTRGPFCILAERVGFEPTVRGTRTLDFESSPFDHSGTSPIRSSCYAHLIRLAPSMALALRAHVVRPKRLSCRFVESSPFDHSGTSPRAGDSTRSRDFLRKFGAKKTTCGRPAREEFRQDPALTP